MTNRLDTTTREGLPQLITTLNNEGYRFVQAIEDLENNMSRTLWVVSVSGDQDVNVTNQVLGVSLI